MIIRKFIVSAGFLLAADISPYTISRFETHHDRWIREYFGCPPAPAEISHETCRLAAGRLNYGEFLKARKAAKELYHLQECQ